MPEVITRLYKQLSVRGADAAEFLQGQLTQDVASMPLRNGLPAAWCNARGRVITTTRIFGQKEGFDLMLPASIADLVGRKLQMYVLRSKVALSFDDRTWSCLVARHAPSISANKLPESILSVEDTEGTGYAEYFTPNEQASEVARRLNVSPEPRDWMLEMIRGGRVMIDDVSSEKYTPHMLNLDKSGAVSFSKGCYTGQEVVARTENLGKSRRRLAFYTGAPETCRSGEKLFAGDTPVGEIVNVADGELLAVVPTDVHQQSISASGATLLPGTHLAAD